MSWKTILKVQEIQHLNYNHCLHQHLESGQVGNDSVELLQLHDGCVEKRIQQLAESSNVVECRRPPSGTMKYAVGMVVRHGPLNLTGVIVSWDLSCKKSDDWIERNGIRDLARGSDQPFYEVLVHDSATSHRYWPEGNLIRGNF